MITIINRPFWLKIFEENWKKRPIIWLHGARQVGKTSLGKMIEGIIYMNCDLPSVKNRLADPESFYNSLEAGNIVVFDEIHRLNDPSQILKIGADEFPGLRILATGSSTLEATHKFRDSLTGRKTAVYLPPVLWDECQNTFGIKDFDRRLLRGGLPGILLSNERDDVFYAEWIDSFYARDIQELFNIRNRDGYIRLMHLLYRSSGNLIEYGQLAKLSGLSRPTVSTYLESLRIANNIFLVPPYHGGGKREITQRPKCYAFDTGMVTFMRGWNEIREEDRGILWEHLVLDTLRTLNPEHKIYYWRDKSDREIDFVIPLDGGNTDIYECKINPDRFSMVPVLNFREFYPSGRNFCICPFIKDNYSVIIKGHKIEFINISHGFLM
jgi:predicted AAA+ superfamily ATPase